MSITIVYFNCINNTYTSYQLAKKLFGAGLTNHVLEKWLSNPTVDGKGVFDHMYGLDGEQCVKKAAALAGRIDQRLFKNNFNSIMCYRISD